MKEISMIWVIKTYYKLAEMAVPSTDMVTYLFINNYKYS
jgi:hypothetical protein